MTKEIWHFHQWNNVCLIDIYVECTASHVHSWLWADGMFWNLHKRPHKLENDISKPFHHQSSAATVAYKWSVFNSSKRLKWHSSYLQIHKSHLKWHEYMFAECKMCEIFHNRKWIFPTITDFMHEKCTKIVDDKFSTPIMTIQWKRHINGIGINWKWANAQFEWHGKLVNVKCLRGLEKKQQITCFGCTFLPIFIK